ncbi:L,D-transpeptidase family protein [Metabacillus idriensis]|uniref:L,D-transpeptidase family protein n=1 Tax=Metabacillus idriensis TaxID=324768 RepID=UPI00174847DE|nr:L,D-transpeptidase family protein [Metabacillus idriensis]
MIHIVRPGETLNSIALDYRTSAAVLAKANQITNPNLIFPGQSIVIPGLPDPASIPYTINISVRQRKLTLLNNGQVMKVYPIAVGKIVTSTPIGNFVIVNRQPNPGGPFGVLWLSLSKIHYGIHGTNDPSSIGKAVSKGCIRMQNRDVLELGSIVPNGTRVFIRPV